MAQSFTATEDQALAQTKRARRKVLVTGAAGKIGSYFAEHSNKKYELRLMIREGDDRSKIEKFGEIVAGDITDLDRMKEFIESRRQSTTQASMASTSAAGSTP